MKSWLVAAILLVVAHSTVVPHVGPIQTHVPLTFKVQIDEDPKTRWAPIIKTFNQTLGRLIQFLQILPIPKGFYDGVEWYAKNQFIHQDFVREVDAVATLSNLPFEKIFFINFMYEYSTFAACTGLLVRTPEGKIIHGRNLDFQMWEILSKLLTTVEYYRGDQRIFSSDIVVGSVFALTGIKHGAFAVNCDTRYAKHFSDDLISILKNNAIPTLWLLQKVLAEESNYTAAVKRLKTERIGGPVYFIISGVGPNEGTVLQRDTDGLHASYELSDSTWFLVQTNYDRDQPDPIHDPRRVPVQNKLKERGNVGMNEQVLFDLFMSQWPTFNIASIMTAIMVPATGYRNTTAWYGSNPTIIQQAHLSSE